MIDRVPQPSLLAFAAHKAPQLIHLGFLHLPKDDVNVQRSTRGEQPFVHLLDGWRFFFEHVDDRGRTDPQDTDDIAHPTAIECHVNDLLFHSRQDRKSTRLNSSHLVISYAVFCLKKKNNTHSNTRTLLSTTMVHLYGTQIYDMIYILTITPVIDSLHDLNCSN